MASGPPKPGERTREPLPYERGAGPGKRRREAGAASTSIMAGKYPDRPRLGRRNQAFSVNNVRAR
jgi:hypothetical protein